MIILDDQDSEQQTQINAAGQVKSGPSNAPPRPALGGPGAAPSSSHWNAPPPPSPPPLYSKHHHITPSPFVPAYPRSPARRFWAAFAVAFIIYFALVGTTRTVIHLASHRMFSDDGSVGAPQFDDGNVLWSISSLNWTSYGIRPRWAPGFERSAETSFTLPVSSDELYLISRGSQQHGRIELVQSTEDGDVKVNIRVAYHHDRALARSTICQLRRGANGNGIGIYTPTPWWHISPHSDSLRFDVTVTFPSAHSELDPLRVKKFTTQTGNFVHESGELKDTLLFDDIELVTSNSLINLKSISATTGSLKSSNAPIRGHFNTSNSLNLRTSNAPINAMAYLLSSDERRTTLVMRTSNGPITAEVSLFTPRSGGSFDVVAQTANGHIDLEYPEAPLGACLRSEAKTSNDRASVNMHPSFEGSFEVTTSNARPTIRDTHPTDPSGNHRRRIINQTNSRGVISGSVSWGANDRRGGAGYTKVHTSNGGATLIL